MKFAIVSDTHGNVANFKKVAQFLNKESIELILHCGDIGDPQSLQESLEGFTGRLFGVFGNMDADYKILIDEYNKIPRVKVFENTFEKEIDGKKIGIVHFPDIARKMAESGKYDLVFYGHTHKPWEQKIGTCRLVNPGELTGQRFKPTFALYDTNTNTLQLKILEKL